MKTNIFNLQIIEIKNIRPQEVYDEKNSLSLLAKIKEENKIRNPIIVAPMGRNTFIQLDGMNRLSVFKMLNIPSILCHVVDYQDINQVELASWVHLNKLDSEMFMNEIKKINNLEIRNGSIDEVKNRYVLSTGLDRICTVISKDGKVFYVSASGDLLDKIEILNKIVAIYNQDISRDVLPQKQSREDIRIVFKEHPTSNTLVVFPTFTRHQIMKIVKKGSLIPPGLTRHIIKRRCLDVDMSLDLFTSVKTIEEKNNELERLLIKRRFRLYEEPTIYFE